MFARGRMIVSGALALVMFVLGAGNVHAYVYWSEPFGDSLGVSRNDGQMPIAQLVANPGVFGVAVDGSHLYFSQAAANRIGRANLDGTNPDPDWFSIPTSGTEPLPVGLAVDDTYVYFASQNRDEIGRVSKTDTNQYDTDWVATTADQPTALAIAEGSLFWTYTGGAKGIQSTVIADTTGVTDVISGLDYPDALAAHGSELFVGQADSIDKLNVDGTGLGEWLQTNDSTLGLAANDDYLYWSAGADGALWRAPWLDSAQAEVIGNAGDSTRYGVAADNREPSAQTISFNQPPTSAPGATVELTASSTSSLPVTLTSLTPNVCSVQGAVALLLAVGECGIEATQPGNTFVAAAEPVTRSFQVTSGRLAQVPLKGCAKVDRKVIRRSGMTLLMNRPCVTNAGRNVKVRVKAHSIDRTQRGDLRLFRVVRAKQGTYIKTYGYPLTLRITWSAPATSTHFKYLAKRNLTS